MVNIKFQNERTDKDGVTEIKLGGVLNENVNLDEVFTNLQPKVLIDLSRVVRINSVATRTWINLVEGPLKDKSVYYTGCSIAMIRQFNMIDNMGGKGMILSFFAPYFCDPCNRYYEVKISIKKHGDQVKQRKAPDFFCPTCKTGLEFDDLEEKYFHFTRKAKFPVYKKPSAD